MKTQAKNPEKAHLEQTVLDLQSSRPVIPSPLVCLLFAVLVLLLYSNTFQSPFIFDDWYHIEANPHIRLTSLSWDAILQAAFNSPLDRPVAYITLALNYYFNGYALLGYHLVNIFVHLGAAIFLYMFLQATLSLKQAQQQSSYGGWLPLTAALLWLVHPVQIQSVTYIIQRMNSLAAMFYILSMLLYVRGRLTKGRVVQVFLFIGSICSGILALGSKEIAATLPAFILLYEWFFFQDLNFFWLRKKILPLLGVGLLLACVVILFLGLHPFSSISNSYGIRDFTLIQRILTEFRVVLFYISLLLFPFPGRLNLDHEFQLSFSLLEPAATLFSLGLLLGLFGLAILLAKRERLISFSILWFLGNLVIESSVIGLEIIFEHRTYLPSMMAIFAAVLLGSRVLSRKWPRIFVTLLIITIFSMWTFQRNMVWQDEVTLRRDAVAKSPTKARAVAILANALERNHEYDEAAYFYRKTLSLAPPNAASIHYNLGNVLVAQKKYSDAVHHFSKALALEPDEAPMRLNLAYALSLQGNISAASSELQELIRRHPKDPRAHNNLGLLLMQQGKTREAVLHFKEALAIKPNYKQARLNLEKALYRLQRETGRR